MKKWVGFYLSAGLLAGALASAGKPNVIFILTDDLGYSDVGCYGAKTVKTPHVDRLAAEGIRFTDFHTAASICSPSRAAFLTGAYPQRCGLYMGINPKRTAHWFLGLHPDEITLAEQFKKQGYDTCMVGKWHLGTEPEFSMRKQGFDDYYNCENLQAVRTGHWKLHLPRTAAQVPFWEKNKAFFKLEAPVLYDLAADPGETTDVAAQHPEIVTRLNAVAKEARGDLGEYLKRGGGQRATGSVIAAAPVLSHEKDWDKVDAGTAKAIARERLKRHPSEKTKRKNKR